MEIRWHIYWYLFTCGRILFDTAHMWNNRLFLNHIPHSTSKWHCMWHFCSIKSDKSSLKCTCFLMKRRISIFLGNFRDKIMVLFYVFLNISISFRYLFVLLVPIAELCYFGLTVIWVFFYQHRCLFPLLKQMICGKC